LISGESILRFDFGRRIAPTGYVITVTFEDGTLLNIYVN
jgi:hypothetical protein